MKNLFFLIGAFLLVLACNTSGEKIANAENLTETNALVIDTINIIGMTCTGCEQTICKAVGGLKGISSVSASYLDSIAIVEYNPELISIGEIGKEIATVGYTAKIPD